MNIQKKVELIRKHLDEKEGIVILKGFDSEVYKHLQDRFLDKDIIDEEGFIDLKHIKATKIFIKTMAQPTPALMTMESLIELAASFNNMDILGKKFFILRNNLLEKYPNPTKEDIPDFESERFENETENQVYCKFYSYCEHKDGLQWINYIEPDFGDSTCFETVDFVTPDNVADISSLILEEEDCIGLQRSNPTTTGGEGIPVLSMENGTLEDVLSKLYFDLPLESEKYALLVTEREKDKGKNKNKYGVLSAALKYGHENVRLYWKKPQERKVIIRRELYQTMKNVWGYESFRELKMYRNLEINRDITLVSQGEIVETVVSEAEKALRNRNFSNILLTSPTGAGKSLLFQLSAIYLAENYHLLTIVVSPLLALMDDQVANLYHKYPKVAALNSNKSADESNAILKKTQNGEINILYLSPELMLSHSLESLIGERRVGLVVIDEAHTVTTWGRDFRVDYWFLGDYLRSTKKYIGYNFPIFALTATAVWDKTRKNDMVFETIDSLNMDPCIKYIGVVRRDNISFQISRPPKVRDYERQRQSRTIDAIQEAIDNNRKSIFYFPYVKHIGDIIEKPELQLYRNKITQFHSKLLPAEKEANAAFFRDGVCPIICASKAFGMGVDVPDITEVYHHAPTGSLPDYIQEIGRLARDESLQGIAKIDFNEQDFKYTRQLHGLSTIKPYQLEAVLRKLMELYYLRGEKRNMMVSPEDFSFIFTGNDDIDQKFKSCLLLISHDMMRQLHFRAIIVRPKNLFADTYIELPSDEASSFYLEYRDYLSKIPSQSSPPSNASGPRRFILHAERFWNKHYSSMSFPQFKNKLMSSNIFRRYHVKPIVRLDIDLTGGISLSLARTRLMEFFDNAKALLDDLANPVAGQLRHKKFREIKESLIDYSPIKREEFLRGFILAYAPDTTCTNRIAYCQVKTKESEEDNQIVLLRHGYEALKNQIIDLFDFIIKDNTNTCFCSVNDPENLLAEILNCLNIASFQRVGGADPQVFIRINNPRYLNSVLRRGKYTNKMLADIYNKHDFSEKVFTHFFSSTMSDKERWDFIEAYFLGASEEELMQYGKSGKDKE